MAGVGTTHHVKIGGDYFIVRPGSYHQKSAPVFGPRFTTGDPDYSSLSFWQHWVQRCWIGGFDAPEWQDEAMFDKSVGVDTSNHEVLLLARDLGADPTYRTAHNYDLTEEVGSEHKREFFTWSGDGDSEKLYCLSYDSGAGGNDDARLFRFVPGDWELVHTFGRDCRSVARWGNRVYFGTAGTVLQYMDGSPGSEVFHDVDKPDGVDAIPRAMRVWRGQLWVGFDDALWRLQRNNTWDGSTAFYEATDVSRFSGMEPHLGFLYFSSANGHILRTDGNNTFDMWSMEPGTEITSIRSFDGRLFVACRDPLEGTAASEAVLYQFTGAAVTELKRLGEIGVENSFGKLRAIGGRLMMGSSSLFGFEGGFGLTMYDAVEDSYHIFASKRDATNYPDGGTEHPKWIVDDVIWFGGYLWASVRGYGIFRTPYTVRDVSEFLALYDNSAAGGVASNGGWLESSEFDAGTPGLRKLWNAIVLDVDLPTTDTSVEVEYSLDGGDSWVSAGTATLDVVGQTRYQKLFRLGGATGGVYSSTFKYRLILETTDSTYSPAVRGIGVRYLPVPEPNWIWDMTLVLSDNQELLDGTTEQPNNDTKLSNLKDAFRDQSLVTFTDIDGVEWEVGGDPGVLIQTLDVQAPFVGPSSDGALEYEVRITLIEAVEDYDA